MSEINGALRGLQTGLGIASSIQQQVRQAARDDEEKNRRASETKRQAKIDNQNDAKLGLSVLGDDEKRYAATLKDTAARGGASSLDEASQIGNTGRELDSRREALNAQLLGREYQAKVKQADNTFARLRSGETDLQSLSAQELGDAVTYKTAQPFSDFIDAGDKPGRIGEALTQFHGAFQGGDLGGILTPVNQLLRPEIEQGTGSRLTNGDKIVGKKISQILPHPDDPAHAVIGLSITAQRPDGTTYEYEAPMTEGRRHDDDEVKNVPIGKSIERIGAYGELHDALNDPSVAASVAQKAAEYQKSGALSAYEKLRAGYIQHGGDPDSFDEKLDYKSVSAGGSLVGLNKRGEVKSRIEGQPKPVVSKGVQTVIDAIEDSELPDETKQELKQRALVNAAHRFDPKAGRGGSSKPSGMLIIDHEGNQREFNRGDDIPAGSRVVRVTGDPRKSANDFDEVTIEQKDVLTGTTTRRKHREPREAAAQKAPPAKAAPVIVEGSRATNPETGERIVFKGGKWQPLK